MGFVKNTRDENSGHACNSPENKLSAVFPVPASAAALHHWRDAVF
jgi:hypothetical protein